MTEQYDDKRERSLIAECLPVEEKGAGATPVVPAIFKSSSRSRS